MLHIATAMRSVIWLGWIEMRVYGFAAQPNRNNSGPDALLLRVLNGRLTGRDLSLFFTGTSGGSREGFMLTRLLRLLVDRWIDSGKDEDRDSPWTRRPWIEPIEDYAERNPPKLLFTKRGLPFLFVGSPPPESGEARDSELARFIEDRLAQVDGSLVADVRFRKALRAAAWSATALFLQVLDSPHSGRLSRCDGCRAYFWRKRAPKRDHPVSRGSWCELCKAKGGAYRADKSRESRRGDMVKRAAEAWTTWKPDQPNRYGSRREWVAKQVSKRLPGGRSITGNWVTRHTAEIEAEVERRNHATR